MDSLIAVSALGIFFSLHLPGTVCFLQDKDVTGKKCRFLFPACYLLYPQVTITAGIIILATGRTGLTGPELPVSRSAHFYLNLSCNVITGLGMSAV